MFVEHVWQSRSSVTTEGIDTEVKQISDSENRLSKIPCSTKIKSIDKRHKLVAYKEQNSQLKGILDSKELVNAIGQAVATGLKLSSQPTNNSGAGTTGTRFVSKSYLGKPKLSQLAPGANGSLNPDLEC